jgi:hypothetical protein
MTKQPKPVKAICRRGCIVTLPCSDEQMHGAVELCANDGRSCELIAFIGEDD